MLLGLGACVEAPSPTRPNRLIRPSEPPDFSPSLELLLPLCWLSGDRFIGGMGRPRTPVLRCAAPARPRAPSPLGRAIGLAPRPLLGVDMATTEDMTAKDTSGGGTRVEQSVVPSGPL